VAVALPASRPTPCEALSGKEPFWPLHEYIWKASWSE
jgi:hypothetical protein